MNKKQEDNVVVLLERLVALRQDRHKQYGDTFTIKGEMMAALFPNGVRLNTPNDFKRYNALNMITSKLIRYCNNFHVGGHVDSLDDIAVYSMILQDIDCAEEEQESSDSN